MGRLGLALGNEDHRGDQMDLEILADHLELLSRCDADCLQVVSATDARKHKDPWRVDRAGRQNGLPGRRRREYAVDRVVNPSDPDPVEDQPVH